MLDKAIEHGKEKRKPYRHSARFDRSCRNHGGCAWCEGNRTVSLTRLLATAQLRDEPPEPPPVAARHPWPPPFNLSRPAMTAEEIEALVNAPENFWDTKEEL